MASKKKRLRKLKKQLLKAENKVKKSKQKIERLGRKLGKRDTHILELERRLEDRSEDRLEQASQPEFSLPDAAEFQEDSFYDAISRDALKKASFLRDRYEFHLGQNKPKPLAREEANNDLIAQYGEESGFTEQELQDVLS